MPSIATRIESARGCGYRKNGGIYLIAGALSNPCGKLPLPLNVCPCCGQGIKFTRGFTWIKADLFSGAGCQSLNKDLCFRCPANLPPETQLGLLWVGESFYKSTTDFVIEASRKGISRRIAAVPRNFKVGQTWIALAHIKAIRTEGQNKDNDGWEYSPGIFMFFKPMAIEYIVTGNETEDELIALEKRGFTLINVIRDIDTQTRLLE